MGFAIYISAIHRYVQVAPFSWFYRQYNNLYIRFTIYILAFIGIQLAITFPMFLLRVPPEILQEYTLETAPQLEYYFTHESSIAGYRRSVRIKSGSFAYVLIAVFGVLIISILLLTINYFRIMRKNQNSLEHGVVRCQVRSLINFHMLLMPILELTFAQLQNYCFIHVFH